KEGLERQVATLIGQREQKRQDRGRLALQAQTVRNEWRAQQEQFHARELEATNLRHQRDTLVLRIREDYLVELAELYQSSKSQGPEALAKTEDFLASASGSIQAANEEITELRRKLSRLGSVNLDSLQELNELEGRATAQQAQFADLTSAKKSLEDIIA